MRLGRQGATYWPEGADVVVTGEVVDASPGEGELDDSSLPETTLVKDELAEVELAEVELADVVVDGIVVLDELLATVLTVLVGKMNPRLVVVTELPVWLEVLASPVTTRHPGMCCHRGMCCHPETYSRRGT